MKTKLKTIKLKLDTTTKSFLALKDNPSIIRSYNVKVVKDELEDQSRIEKVKSAKKLTEVSINDSTIRVTLLNRNDGTCVIDYSKVKDKATIKFLERGKCKIMLESIQVPYLNDKLEYEYKVGYINGFTIAYYDCPRSDIDMKDVKYV